MTNMARILTEEQFKKRFMSIMEYTQAMSPNINDEILNEEDPTGEDEMGGMDPSMGGDPSAAGMDPSMGGGVQGLNPQGGEEAPAADMPEDETNVDTMEDGDEVIDVDELTGYQKRTAKGVGEVSDEIKALKDLIIKFQEKVDANNQGLESLQREIEKRVPSQEEKLSLRKKQSSPFSETIEDYWDNNAPENYSVEDDKNGEGNPKYQITKSDIDGFDNWNEIARSFDNMAELNNIKKIFGY